MQVVREKGRERAAAVAVVAAIHALLGYAFISGLGYEVASRVADTLKVFDVPGELPPPPPEPVRPQHRKADAAEGAASPPNLKAKPAPVVAPPPVVPIEVPPPIVAAPVAGAGSEDRAGASELPGPGFGSGGVGSGLGSGSQGSGTGSGGVAKRAQWLKGGFAHSDYPRAARKAGAQGTVIVRFTVGIDGRANDCTVMVSSGNADLDGTTCRLIERRYRYAPARNAQGNAVPDVMGRKQTWWIEPGGSPREAPQR